LAQVRSHFGASGPTFPEACSLRREGAQTRAPIATGVLFAGKSTHGRPLA